jgi:hypothetical protein
LGARLGERKVKTRTLENHKDAAPKTILTVNLSATRHLGCRMTDITKSNNVFLSNIENEFVSLEVLFTSFKRRETLNPSNVVLNFTVQVVTKGNIQAHVDQK